MYIVFINNIAILSLRPPLEKILDPPLHYNLKLKLITIGENT